MNRMNQKSGGEKLSMRKKLSAVATTLTAFIGSAAAEPTSSGLGVQLAELTNMLAQAFSNWIGAVGDGTQAIIGFSIVILTGLLTGVLVDKITAAISVVLALLTVSYLGLIPGWLTGLVVIMAAAIVARWGVRTVRGE